jgi:hypothetical protein
MIPFIKVKNSSILGLDDTIDFGRHKGYTVLEIIKDRPQYIDWLIKEGKKFYPSVIEELARQRAIQIYEKTKSYIYDGQLRGDLSHYESEIEAIAQDWDSDIPF